MGSVISTGSRGVQFEQVNKKSSYSVYLLKCNHEFRFPLKTSSAMHLCKFVTVHIFIVLILFALLKPTLSFYFRSFYC